MNKLIAFFAFTTLASACLIQFEKQSSCGCGCAPPPRPCCPPPCCPPPCCPPPPSCGCGCGRKKREALISHTDSEKCNSAELKEILEKNMKKTVMESLKSLKEATNDYSQFLITCSDDKLFYRAGVDEFCQVYTPDVVCAILRFNVPKSLEDDDTDKKRVIRALRLLS